jgi:hypothetical protein
MKMRLAAPRPPGGREWFLISTKFLDWTAAQRGLSIDVVAVLDGGIDLD